MQREATVKTRSKKVVTLIVILTVCTIILYALICCGITFVPMVAMVKANATACGEAPTPPETYTLANEANIYAFPVEHAREAYVVICPGGGYTDCAVQTEGFAVAAEWNKLGYSAFVLEYRTGKRITTPKAPLDDLANAITYIDRHAAQYDVRQGQYILCGFSAGGNLIGLFGTTQFGYSNYEGVAAPAALVMGYPWCNPTRPTFNGNIAEYAFFATLHGNGAKAFLHTTSSYDDMCVPLWVDAHYPRTFIMHGTEDAVAPAAMHSDVLATVLRANNVDYRYKQCAHVYHGCGIGLGTSAEGWLSEAAAFAEGTA